MTATEQTGRRALESRGAAIVEAGEDAGQRIDNFLVKKLKNVPKSRIYRMIRKGEVRVNGGRIKPAYRLLATDQVRIPPYHARPAEPIFIGEHKLASIEAAILHEDDRLLVLDKPVGLAVHGGSGVSFGAIEALRRLRPNASLELVHRLDRDTSGCLLVSKRRSMLRSLHEQFRNGTVEKSYQLIVHGRWPRQRVRIDDPLEKFQVPGGERRVRGSPDGKPSLTTFEIVDRADNATLLRAELHTGRTHQIRVHAQGAGHSVVGDEKYASEKELAADRGLRIQRLCLHAQYLRIATSEGVQAFESPLPRDFKAAWNKFS